MSPCPKPTSVRRYAQALGLLTMASGFFGACFDPEEGYSAYALETEQVRELPFKEVVKVYAVSREMFEETENSEGADEEETAEEIEVLYETWGRLGFFSRSDDLTAVRDSTDDLVLAFYDHSEGAITVIGEPAPETVVHEYVHALQDQHFDLSELNALATTSDEYFATRAVTEGDASLIEARYLLQKERGEDLHDVDWQRALTEDREQVLEFMRSINDPLFFYAYPTFTYAFGREYMLNRLIGATITDPANVTGPLEYDWYNYNIVMQQPPRSTEAVVRYTDVRVPASVGLGTFPKSVADRYISLGQDTIGFWLTFVLLFPVDDSHAALENLSGWKGDQVEFVWSSDTGAAGVVWTSEWRSPAHARYVASGVWDLYGAQGSPDRISGVAADNEAVHVERRGARLVVTKNIVAEDAERFAKQALDGNNSGVGPARPPSFTPTLRRLFSRSFRHVSRRGVSPR